MTPSDVRAKRLLLAAVCLGLLMPQIDLSVINLALPSVRASLGTGAAGMQWVLDAYNLAFASILLTGGTLGDLFGRRRAFLIGLAIFTGGSVVCGLAHTLTALVAGRALQGFGAAIELPGTLSILTVAYTEAHERAHALGIRAGMSGLAMALGPTAGALMLDRLGWPSIFFLNLPVGVATLALTLTAVPESASPEGRRLDLPGQILAAACLGGLTYAVIQSHSVGWTSPVILGCLSMSAAGFVALLAVERRTPGPMVNLAMFRHAPFSASLGVATLMTFGIYGQMLITSVYLQTILGMSPLLAGLGMLPDAIGFLGTSVLTGRLTARYGARTLMAGGMALTGVGVLIAAWATGVRAYWPMGAGLGVIGVGLGLNTGPLMSVAVGSVPASRSGMASGLVHAGRMVGATLGVAVLGTIAASHAGAAGRSLAMLPSDMGRALAIGGIGELAAALLALLFVGSAVGRRDAAAEQVETHRPARAGGAGYAVEGAQGPDA